MQQTFGNCDETRRRRRKKDFIVRVELNGRAWNAMNWNGNGMESKGKQMFVWRGFQGLGVRVARLDLQL
jgi:hypothetical protein